MPESGKNGPGISGPADDSAGFIKRSIFPLERDTLFLGFVSLSLLFTGFYVLMIYSSYVWSAFFALFLFVGFDRYNRFLIRIFGGRRTLAASLSVITVIVLILVPAYLLFKNIDIFDSKILKLKDLTYN